MYLEISGRQTGKTTRAISLLKAELIKQRHCVLITPRSVYGQEIRKKLRGEVDADFLYTYSDTNAALEALRGIVLPEDAFWIYDEFDFVRGEVYITDNGAYLTTPRYMRTVEQVLTATDDPLLNLLRANRGDYVGRMSKSLSESAVGQFSLRDFTTQVLGRWIDLPIALPTNF